MNIPDEAVQAAARAHTPQFNNMDPTIQKYALEQMRAALTAAAPFLQGVKVDGAKIEAARNAVEELANTHICLTLEDWSRISSTILSAIEVAPSPRTQALEEAARHLEDEAAMSISRSETCSDDMFDEFCDRAEYFKEAASFVRALSSQPVADHVADAGKVEGDGQSDLRGMKIALEQAWESNRERQNEIIRLKDALCNFTDGRDISYVEALEIARSLTGVQ